MATTARKPVAKRATPSSQFILARKRIQTASANSFDQLDLTDLSKLSQLPKELSELSALRRLFLSGTKVDDLSLVAGLSALETLSIDDTEVTDLAPIAKLNILKSLSLEHTKIRDLAPISGLTSLESLLLDNTQVEDLAPLALLSSLQHLHLNDTKVADLRPVGGLMNLETLWLDRTNVSDLTPIAKLTRLRKLWLDYTPVKDLAPVAALNRLETITFDGVQVKDLSAIGNTLTLDRLSMRGTGIEDLAPLANLTNLQDAALNQGTKGYYGLYFENSAISKTAPYDQFAGIGQPASTVETINEVRRRRGLPPHIPSGYVPPSDLPAALSTDIDIEAEDDGKQLGQRPASHSFAFHRGQIEAQPQRLPPRYPDIASDIRNEVSEKAKEAAARLARSNAPQRIVSTVTRLGSSLGTSLQDMRAGILQMRFRSLEADVAAYDTEEGRRELPEDAIAMLRDLTSSVEDLMGCFPELGEIEAERLAQRLKEADVPSVIQALSQIRELAEESEAVASSAVEALKAGEPELTHDAEIIESGASEAARNAAVNARDRTVGYMLLVYRNFVAGVVKAGSELAGVGAETWKEFRKDAPKQLSDAGVALAVAALVGALLGPTAAVGAFAVTFKPLRERARRVADKLASVTKKTRNSARETIEIEEGDTV